MSHFMMKHLLPVLIMLGTCCAAFGNQHPIVGKWSYVHNGKQYEREFTKDNRCILKRPNGSIAWNYAYKVVNSRTVDVRSSKTGKNLRHQILPDGRLRVEGKTLATRTIAPRIARQMRVNGFSFNNSLRLRPGALKSACCKWGGRTDKESAGIDCKYVSNLGKCDGGFFIKSVKSCSKSPCHEKSCPGWTCTGD